MSRNVVRFFAGLALLAAPMVAAEAQSVCVGEGSTGCSLTRNASLTVPQLFRLALTADSITLATPDWSTDSLAGQLVTTNAAAVNVRANTAWVLTVSTAAAAWTYVGLEGGARALSTLELEEGCASGTWNVISSSAVEVANGARTNGAGANICLRTVFPADYTDAANRPGVYQLPITVTVAAP